MRKKFRIVLEEVVRHLVYLEVGCVGKRAEEESGKKEAWNGSVCQGRNLSSAGRSWTVMKPCFIFSRTLGGFVAMRPGRRLQILSRNDDELN